MSIRLFLVDDHALVRDGLRAYLQTQPDIDLVGEAETAAAAMAAIARLKPDVALVDLLLPDQTGIAVTEAASQTSPGTRVIVLTSSNDEAPIRAAFKAGALSYLSKSTGAAALVAAVRAAALGTMTLSSQAERVLRQPLREQKIPVNLSARETEVLSHLALGHSNAEIAAALGIGESTVKTHVSNVLGKLKLSDRTQAAVYAWREGLV